MSYFHLFCQYLAINDNKDAQMNPNSAIIVLCIYTIFYVRTCIYSQRKMDFCPIWCECKANFMLIVFLLA